MKSTTLVHDTREDKQIKELLQDEKGKLLPSENPEALARVLNGAAHEFNNLLTMIMGYSGLMLTSLDSKETLVDYIKKINQASKRASDITRQLLATSHAPATAAPSFDLNTMLYGTREILSSVLGSSIVLDFAPTSEAVHVRADQSQIRQLLIHLALNARRAMSQGGKFSISITATELGPEGLSNYPGLTPGEYVKLTIGSTGAEITGDAKPRLVVPFSKESRMGPEAELAVVHKIVRENGGAIWEGSRPNGETIVRILLPRVVPPHFSDASGAPGLRGTETILLVEDEELLREVTREFLLSLGYKVLEAKGGEEATRRLEQHQGRIDLLLTDVMMPGMSGREIVQRIRQLSSDVKVIYISGYMQDVLAKEDIAADGEEFLGKPFRFEELARKIRALLPARPQ